MTPLIKMLFGVRSILTISGTGTGKGRGVWIIILIGLVFCGCNRHMLDVRSQYLTPDCLASDRVDTPDPLRRCFFGQEVIVHWGLPRRLFCEDQSLHAIFRFVNREVVEFDVPLKSSRGYWKYRLLNDDFLRVGGVLSYKVELCLRGEVIYTWRHHLWADLITIGSSP